MKNDAEKDRLFIKNGSQNDLQMVSFGALLKGKSYFWDHFGNDSPPSAVPELTFAVPELIFDDFS